MSFSSTPPSLAAIPVPEKYADLLTPDILRSISESIKDIIISERINHPENWRVLLLGLITYNIRGQYGDLVLKAVEKILTQIELDKIIKEVIDSQA
jgi:hypothetical protein